MADPKDIPPLRWLRYVAREQVAGLKGIDRQAVPWTEVAEREFCSRCLGLLPADNDASCPACGPNGVPTADAIYPQQVERARLARSPWDGFRAVGCA